MASREAAALDKACDWVLRRLELFDPGSEAGDFTIPRAQQFSELLLSAYCLSRNGPRYGDVVHRIVDWCESKTFNDTYRRRLRSNPDEFVLYSDVHAILAYFGRADAETSAYLQALIDAGALGAFEKVAHRWLDLRLSMSWSGLDHDLPSYPELAAQSIASFRRPIAPFILFPTSEGAYAFTHVLMFIHGFGTSREMLVDPEVATQWASALRQLMVVSARDRHWDLLAESILCHDCIESAPSGLAEDGLALLLERQGADGNFLGPEGTLGASLDQAANPSFMSYEEAEFRFTYHTTLVAIMLLVHRLGRRGGALR